MHFDLHILGDAFLSIFLSNIKADECMAKLFDL